ncbi:hypothetical protein TRAPUB_13825 [Trametes pubescens]|uniref:Uncharacterized protein n=1 Tax=Trametes pubescens TaxID=154538 RepID=A0A1M2VQ90_TRAPU|nr:hypothetical protein TRAPUB_13825 [Trametes pubescens]
MPAFRHTPQMVHDSLHFNLRVSYDPATRQSTRTWVWEKEQVFVADWHLHLPKAKSTGEKFPMVSPRAPASAEPYYPEFGAGPLSCVSEPKSTPEIGARYCHQLHAIVPEHLAYKVGKLAPARTPLRERLLTREFWHLPFAGEDGGDGDVASTNSAGIEIKLIPARDGTTVLAEGLTHHQAALIPLGQAQKDMAIKYRSLTAKRADLLQPEAAQQVNAIKYRTAIGH